MTLYRILISLAAPFILGLAILRMGGLTARLGLVGPAQRGPRIWLHAASNGELTSARPVIDAIQQACPTARFLITTNSITGRDMARDWNDPKIEAQLAPIDLRWVIKRLVKTWQLQSLVIVENELWPNRITTAAELHLPIAVVGARMSENSARTWERLPKFALEIMSNITWLSAQDSASEARFVSLGVPAASVRRVFNLKTLYTPPSPPTDLAALRPLYDRGQTILAASTHIGEDQIILDAFAQAAAQNPHLHLILAPRHPRRRDEIINMLTGRFSFVQHSKRQQRSADTQVTLADTMGDMAMWYQLASATVVCGSFVKKGGHTPFEPAHFGSAILHGPHVENFTASYAALAKEHAAIEVRTADDLADALAHTSAAQFSKMADLARVILAHMAQGDDVFDSLIEVVRPPL
ncbi:3-deoxy-D-manno-octulosonic acid transferase [Nereida sp. MMG025]|uniref:3-deoxy-D-manno-octulosonic acid transferase n=1 Tax=Nereida sp. MMG025 TaxID=2909981 RepID=UPI001F292E8B|nr:glycosyltransferase N-terminal domain-containing protein [Nereida sp. MMG025]MCF6445058.1 3-deoxy-D-manno-octulosonic acid transferase [Nereida sp. MMG025]